MQSKRKRDLIPTARQLRKNMTKEERHLWYDFLRTYPLHFTRQKVVGRFIVDFYCAKAKIAVEVDGTQHYDAENAAYDAERTTILQGYGIRVCRIPNNAVNQNFPSVCEYIDEAVKHALCDKITGAPKAPLLAGELAAERPTEGVRAKSPLRHAVGVTPPP